MLEDEGDQISGLEKVLASGMGYSKDLWVLLAIPVAPLKMHFAMIKAPGPQSKIQSSYR